MFKSKNLRKIMGIVCAIAMVSTSMPVASNISAAESNIKKAQVSQIADKLYTSNSMSSVERHEYLYENILKVCNDAYEKIEYNWGEKIFFER